MKARYGGGGSFFDGKHNIHADKRLEKTSLRYFMYEPPSTCSEERLERIKRGEGLVPTAAKQMAEYRKNSVSPAPQREAPVNPFLTTEEASEEKPGFGEEKWLQRKESKGDLALKSSLKNYLSKGMQQYMSQRTFEPSVEMHKLENLDRFFRVRRRQEKYFLVSDLLGEPVSTSGADMQAARHILRSEKSRTLYPDRKERHSTKKPTSLAALRKIEQWREKLDKVDEEIDKIVEKKVQSQRHVYDEVMRQEAKARAFLGAKRESPHGMSRSKSQITHQKAASYRHAAHKSDAVDKKQANRLPPLLPRHYDL